MDRLARSLLLVVAVLVGCSSSETGASDLDPDPSREAEVVDFIWEYEERRMEGDLDWLVAHLHPGTFDFWTPAECRETLAFKEPFQKPLQELRDSTYVAAFYFDYGEGRRGDYTDLYRVATTEIGPEGDEDGVFTVAFFEGEPKWFGNCDTPPKQLL